MQNKIQQSVFSGVVGTIIMTLLMMLGSAMGMPKMSPPAMLAGMMGVPVIFGWVIHFLIGIVFAAGYVFFFNNWLKKMTSKIARGAFYGIVAFFMAQIGFPVMAAISGSSTMPQPEGSMLLMIIGSVLGHVFFGIAIAVLVKPVAPLTKQIIR
ncbi:MAG: hypothetical protein HYU71_12370 [Bacteroidetes bacterium]|nr:hypothetical protein [Bacteroidota bacterium]